MDQSKGTEMTEPWNADVKGTQVLPLINLDAETILVEAGPGTGKTFGLARRVVRIMHPDGLGVPGRDVLVVAFNRVIAKQLRTEIADALARTMTLPNDTPIIRTVHALCLEIIGEDVRLLLPHEREAMLYDVLHEHPDLKQKYRRHRNAEQALRDHEASHHAHMELWQATRRWLVRHHARLISELPELLRAHIQGGDFTNRKYRHVIVDEFQDLTPGEQRLFLMLRAHRGQFIALGDRRQSIYAFRGNDRAGLTKLATILGTPATPVTAITMTECRRCPAQVVEAANQLMGLSAAARMVPAGAGEANIHVVYWKTPRGEAAGMAKAILGTMQTHPRDRHLVMVTRREFGFMLRDNIAKLDPTVSVDLSFSESLLETWPVREAFLFFCLLVDPDPPTWRAWLGYQNCPEAKNPFAADRNAGAYLQYFTECADRMTADVIERLASQPREKARGAGGANLWDRAKRFVDLRNAFQWAGASATELLEEVFLPDRWSEHSTEHETAKLDMGLIREKALEMVQGLVEEEKERSAGAILENIARRLRHQIATREPFVSEEGPATLQVATLWGAKGVTADHVYILGLCRQAIPGTRREEYPGTDAEYDDEQRRLFYVSITRPRRTLVLSRATKIRDGDARRLNLSVGTPSRGWVDLKMCPFLREIIEFLPDAQPGESWIGP